MSLTSIIRKLSGQPGQQPVQKPEKEVRSPKRRVQFNIGLDFGTAFTKVVIGESRIRYAVPFTEFNKRHPYTLPCKFYRHSDNKCSLRKKNNSGTEITNLKMRLLEGDRNAATKSEITVFLALVLRYSRSWLLRQHAATYKDVEPDWNINIGLPAENYHDEQLSEYYKDVVAEAWRLSDSNNEISHEDIGETGGEESLDAEKIETFPEFVPQISAYVKSPQRSKGLHSLIDIGAGTVDICVFNIWETEDGDDKFPVFSKDVKNLGVSYLFKHRVAESGYHGEWVFDPFEEPPGAQKTSKLLEISDERLSEIDAALQSEIGNVYIDQLNYVKSERYPKSPKWTKGIPLFLCGGGSRIGFYQNIFQNLSEKPFPLCLVPLENPGQLKAPGLSEGDFDRISVAYGLSYNALDLGEIVRSEDIKDYSGNPEQERGECRNCNGTGGLHNPCQTCGGSGWIN